MQRRCAAVLAFVSLLCAIALVGVGCDQSPAPAIFDPVPPWFENVASSAGVDFPWNSGHDGSNYNLPESIGGGAALFDFDNDGFLDLYLIGAGDLHDSTKCQTNQLLRNKGDGTFEDVTQPQRTGSKAYGMGAATGDYDNDGNTDLYVTNRGANVLYRNNGDGTFSDVTKAAGVECPSWSASAAFTDYDRDGDLDLYVANYVNWSPQSELPLLQPTAHAITRRSLLTPAMDTLFETKAMARLPMSPSPRVSTLGRQRPGRVQRFQRRRLA
jgi:hypothetical protein